MRKERFGELNARVTGGEDGNGAGDGPVVVLLHGFGAPGEDLVDLGRMFRVSAKVRYVFPEAPLSLASIGYGAGRAWWMLDLEGMERRARGERVDHSEDQPASLPQVRAQLDKLLSEVQTRLSVTPDKLIVGGFSQGAMLALDWALHSDKKPAGLILLSGTLIARSEWQPRMSSCRGLPILQSHGRSDTVLSYDDATRLRELLLEAGTNLTFLDFPGGHEIPPQVLDAASRFIVTHAG